MAVTGNGAVGEIQHKKSHSTGQFLDIVALGTSERSIHVNKVTINDQPVANMATISDMLLQKMAYYASILMVKIQVHPSIETPRVPPPPLLLLPLMGDQKWGDIEALNALKSDYRQRGGNASLQGAGRGPCPRAAHGVRHSKKRDKEQGEILLELESKLLQQECQ